MPDEIQLLSADAVRRATGISRSRWYRLRERGDFPAPLRLSSNRRFVVWPSDQIDAWLRERRGETVSVD